MRTDGVNQYGEPSDYEEPLLHHILYVESDPVQIERYGFLQSTPKSIWILLENSRQFKEISNELASQFYRGRIKLYHVAACGKDELRNLDDIYDELDGFRSL